MDPKAAKNAEPDMSDTTHRELILDQFTRQAIPFSTAKTIADENALRLLLDASNAQPSSTMLDVACGGGNVVCAFAKVVKHATGIDMTTAMLERGKALAREKALANVAWDLGEATALPYGDASFDIVTTRFSFHHFLAPLTVLREMTRVCRPGGRIVVTDMVTATDPAKAAEFNRMEVLRDPSHVRALFLTELERLFRDAGLGSPAVLHYELRDELENLLARSFPNPGDDEKIRELFRASAKDDRLGIEIRLEGDRVRYAYPVAILAAIRP
jgi:SAM-dependent methyltransferase